MKLILALSCENKMATRPLPVRPSTFRILSNIKKMVQDEHMMNMYRKSIFHSAPWHLTSDEPERSNWHWCLDIISQKWCKINAWLLLNRYRKSGMTLFDTMMLTLDDLERSIWDLSCISKCARLSYISWKQFKIGRDYSVHRGSRSDIWFHIYTPDPCL